MTNVIEREQIFRMLAGNPTARRVAERGLKIEEEKEGKRKEKPDLYPWSGFEWDSIPAPTQTLNQLVIEELLVTGGPRGTYRSRSTTTYKLKDPELVRECLESLTEIEEGAEEGKIPNDLFDFIIGHDELKNLLFRSIHAEKPVHVLLVGPPVMGGANRDDHIWPELKSRFFIVHLKEYSQADFIQIARSVLVTREKVDPALANSIVTNLAKVTRDVRDAIHLGRLCKTEEDVYSLLRLKFPSRGLF